MISPGNEDHKHICDRPRRCSPLLNSSGLWGPGKREVWEREGWGLKEQREQTMWMDFWEWNCPGRGDSRCKSFAGAGKNLDFVPGREETTGGLSRGANFFNSWWARYGGVQLKGRALHFPIECLTIYIPTRSQVWVFISLLGFSISEWSAHRYEDSSPPFSLGDVF